MADIHRYDLRGVKALSHLRDSGIPEGDKKKKAEFSDVLRARMISLGRVAAVISQALQRIYVVPLFRGLTEPTYPPTSN